jgi:hypothetical protein
MGLLFVVVFVVLAAIAGVLLRPRVGKWSRTVRGPFRVTQLHYYPVKSVVAAVAAMSPLPPHWSRPRRWLLRARPAS